MINGKTFGKVIVDGKTFSHDVLVLADGSIRNRLGHHTFTLEEFNLLSEQNPDVIIVCLGHSSVVKVDPKVLSAAKERGIELIMLSTPEATEKYNELSKEKKIAISVHVTC